MTYNPEILPLAGGVLLAGIICIVLRARFAKSSNAIYGSAGIDKLVFKQAKMEKGMVIAGIALIVLAIGVAISGFFIH